MFIKYRGLQIHTEIIYRRLHIYIYKGIQRRQYTDIHTQTQRDTNKHTHTLSLASICFVSISKEWMQLN